MGETREEMSKPLPCPFCRSIPKVDLGRKGYCQLHGDPYQPVIVSCSNRECAASACVSAGDIYNGGEPKARLEAIAIWNKRESR